jgi:hypothetical protein
VPQEAPRGREGCQAHRLVLDAVQSRAPFIIDEVGYVDASAAVFRFPSWPTQFLGRSRRWGPGCHCQHPKRSFSGVSVDAVVRVSTRN